MKINNFLKFLKKPSYNKSFNFAWEVDFREIWEVFSFQIGLSFFAALLVSLINSALNLEANSLIGIDYGAFQFIFLYFSIIVLAPVLEEILFRLPLKFSAIRFALWFPFILLFSLRIISGFSPFLQNLMNFPHWYFTITFQILLLILFGMFSYWFFRQRLIFNFFDKTIPRFFPYIFYFQAIFFAFLHIFNFTNLLQIWFILPILVFPQILAGLTFGYLRVKFGIFWAWFSHLLNNFLAGNLLLLAYLDSLDRDWVLHPLLQFRYLEIPISVFVLFVYGMAFWKFFEILISFGRQIFRKIKLKN